jgi:uncharacterized protein YdiU (UPF0061 family)
MSIIGDTIDYGPYGFMEYFDEDFVPNTSDKTGRYAYSQQPSIGLWNCEKLADSFENLFQLKGLKELVNERYTSEYWIRYDETMRRKLGFKSDFPSERLRPLLKDLFILMEDSFADFTRTFRILSNEDLSDAAYLIMESIAPSSIKDQVCKIPVPDQYIDLLESRGFDPVALSQWKKKLGRRAKQSDAETLMVRWQGFINQYQQLRDPNSVSRMKSVNPNFILRNYLIQKSISEAETGNFSEVRNLLSVARNPFIDDIKQAFLAPQPAGESCVLSCSS